MKCSMSVFPPIEELGTLVSCSANNCVLTCRGIRDVSHLPLPRDHPAERHSPLFLAVWDLPLPLLSRQHQDRFPGCDGQEGAAPRQSQLKANKTGLPRSSLCLPFPRQKGGSWDGMPLDLLKELSESNCGRVWLSVSCVMAWPGREWESIWSWCMGFRCCRQMMFFHIHCWIWFVIWLINPPPPRFIFFPFAVILDSCKKTLIQLVFFRIHSSPTLHKTHMNTFLHLTSQIVMSATVHFFMLELNIG